MGALSSELARAAGQRAEQMLIELVLWKKPRRTVVVVVLQCRRSVAVSHRWLLQVHVQRRPRPLECRWMGSLAPASGLRPPVPLSLSLSARDAADAK